MSEYNLPDARPTHLWTPVQMNLNHANPFTVRPIETEWTGNGTHNYLLMTHPKQRVTARVASLDIGHTRSSNFLSDSHLMMGWAWCGVPLGANRSDYNYCYLKNRKMAY